MIETAIHINQESGHHLLQFIFIQEFLQINLTNVGFELPAAVITIGDDGTTVVRKASADSNKCYYYGSITHEHSEIGWASICMCNNKSLVGVTYTMHSTILLCFF